MEAFEEGDGPTFGVPCHRFALTGLLDLRCLIRFERGNAMRARYCGGLVDETVAVVGSMADSQGCAGEECGCDAGCFGSPACEVGRSIALDDGGSAGCDLPAEPATKRKRRRKSDSVDVGREGEFVAACFLSRRGYDIIERNWRCRAGEADIIARDGESIVFVEVKSRRDCDKGMPSEAVTKEKRERYERIAACYLAVTDVLDVRVRFDIVSILIIPPDRALVRHHIDAFGQDVY